MVSLLSLVSLSIYLPLYLSSYYLSVCLSDLMSAWLQVFLARQAVRARRKITRRTAKQRLMDSRKILKKLRLLAKEVRGHREVTIKM